MHPRNKHNNGYNFDALKHANAGLKPFLKVNAHNNISIDFSNPKAVKALNKALLALHYNIVEWDIPDQFLCPPIPGRADYIHYLADLLEADLHKKMRGLDIGVGANAIYPLIGNREYGWDFVGVDIDLTAMKNAQHILDTNKLGEAIQLRLQTKSSDIFKGVIQKDDFFDFSMCNPPFHNSLENALKGTQRKLNNLAKSAGKPLVKKQNIKLNFGGQASELFCKGGEVNFINQMIKESVDYKNQCKWFTTLVSKASNLVKIKQTLMQSKVTMMKVVEMKQGQKQSRFIAWSFL